MKMWRTYASLLPECKSVILQNIEEARELARHAEGFDAVVAVGGDGTINAVADGVMKNPDKNLKFGVLYAGTSPDFCTFHKIPINHNAVDVLKYGKFKSVPVLTANGNHFFCSCNLGMGADVAALANRLRPVLGDKFGTFCALLLNILKSKKQDYTVNGEVIPNCNHLLITRMPYIAGGLKLRLPEIKEDEYILWYVENLSFAGWLNLIFRLYRGLPCGKVMIFSGITHIAGNGNVEYDGDPHGTLPLEISVSERKLKLITGDGVCGKMS